MQDMESHVGSWKLQCKLSPVIRSQTIMEGSGLWNPESPVPSPPTRPHGAWGGALGRDSEDFERRRQEFPEGKCGHCVNTAGRWPEVRTWRSRPWVG